MSDNLAQSLGVNIASHKLLAFALGCFFAGVAGAFYAALRALPVSSEVRFPDGDEYPGL